MRTYVLLVLFLFGVMHTAGALLAQVSEPPGDNSTAAQPVTICVRIVDDLVAKPVPLTDFSVVTPEGIVVATVRTDEGGTANLNLPPGSYILRSRQPTRYKGLLYTWQFSFEVTENGENLFTVTGDDAQIEESPKGRVVSDEAKVFSEAKAAVVSVECDFGAGSGFLVDKAGLILTNQHVTAGTRWAAVRLDRRHRYPAVLVHEDPVNDVAVLAVNPQIFETINPLPIAALTETAPVVEGEKILAIGSPLHQEKIVTSGLVSKVEEGAFISDVNINHGNSGGPVLNLAGEVVGIATFLDPGNPSGPGISGIVSITRAYDALAVAKEKLAGTPPPPATPLPVVCDVKIPLAALEPANVKKSESILIRAPKNLETVITTPFTEAYRRAEYERELAKSRNKRVARRSEKGVKEQYEFDRLRFWQEFVGQPNDPVVTIRVRPAPKPTSESVVLGVLGALAGVRTHVEFEYRDDFYDMEIYRSETRIEPIRRWRTKDPVLLFDEDVSMKDVAFGGLYTVDPRLFAPGAQVVLKIRKESDLTKWEEVKIPPKDQERIWREFEPWVEALSLASQTNDGEGTVSR